MQDDRALLAVADLGMRRDDVFAGVGRVDQIDVERLHGVGRMDDRARNVVIRELLRLVREVFQFGIQVAVGVGYAERRLVVVAASEGRIGDILGVVVGVAVALVGREGGRVVDAAAEVEQLHLLARRGAEQERYVIGVDVDELSLRGGIRRAGRPDGTQKE